MADSGREDVGTCEIVSESGRGREQERDIEKKEREEIAKESDKEETTH